MYSSLSSFVPSAVAKECLCHPASNTRLAYFASCTSVFFYVNVLSYSFVILQHRFHNHQFIVCTLDSSIITSVPCSQQKLISV